MVAVAQALAGRPITALCLSLRAAAALAGLAGSGSSGLTLITTPGGTVSGEGLRYDGAACLAALDAFRADLAIIGTCSASPAHGLSVTTSEDAQIKRAILASSAKVVLAATGGKLSRTSSFRFGSLDQVDVLVTTRDAPEAALAEISGTGVTVQIAQQEIEETPSA